MLNKLSIKNFALIDSLEIIFDKGFNVLSGETGSGKSIILESLNFVLGAKADKTLIRSGKQECIVTAEFDLSNLDWARAVYDELDFEFDDTLIITRKFNVDGKSNIKINGNTANVTILKKFTRFLVDVHGQSEHFYLLNTSNQLALLDKFGGERIDSLKKEISSILSDYKSIRREIESLGGDENQRLIKIDVLSYQINEIENTSIKDGEEEELLVIKEKLKHQEKIVNALSSIRYSITNEGGILDIISNSSKEANTISAFSDEYHSLADRISSVSTEVDDISCVCEELLQSFEYNDYNIDAIESRLDDIKKIKRKYGASYQEIVSFLSNAKAEKEKLENFNDLFAELVIKEEKIKSTLYDKYIILRKLREETAEILVKNVIFELKELGMQNAQFDVSFSSVPLKDNAKFDSIGFDSVEFMFSANLGEPLKPLSFVISGGEMSRFMLSIKVQTSKFNDISTFVFDEIDAGISGVVARIVAEKLVKISKNVQVIAISHLPQIVAFGDSNLLIYKSSSDNNTFTNVVKISGQDKVKEISRLIGASSNSKSAEEHSISLINDANEFKKQI